MTDGKITMSSIGSVGICPSNPDVVYIGGGESDIRGNIMMGDGAYKTTDGGKTWTAVGLRDSQVIAKLRLHPSTNCDTVLAAVMGHGFGTSDERGVYKTTDGGKTWRRTLFRDNKTGAVELVYDPKNANIVFAALWESQRFPWGMSSGGPGSGLFRSTDGGDSWSEITKNPGLPTGLWGKVGISVSGADSNRVYALIENEPEGGLYVSDDAGASWKKINDNRNIRQRAFYYTRIYADPKVKDTVWILNVNIYKSTDGGKTIHERARAAQRQPRHVDRAERSEPDDRSERRRRERQRQRRPDVDRSGLSDRAVLSRVPDHAHSVSDLRRAAGQLDGVHVEPGRQLRTGHLLLRRRRRRERLHRARSARSRRLLRRQLRRPADALRSPHRPAAQHQHLARQPDGLRIGRHHRTLPVDVPDHLLAGRQEDDLRLVAAHLEDERTPGRRWTRISPDLSRHDPKTMGASGGPITKDNTGVETYGVVFTIAPTPQDINTIWAGSDDGLIHVTRNGGQNWDNVTPKDLPEFARISLIEASPHTIGTAYVAANRYQMDDMKPYVYKTTDFGKTWTKIVNGVKDTHFARADSRRPRRRRACCISAPRTAFTCRSTMAPTGSRCS